MLDWIAALLSRTPYATTGAAQDLCRDCLQDQIRDEVASLAWGQDQPSSSASVPDSTLSTTPCR